MHKFLVAVAALVAVNTVVVADTIDAEKVDSEHVQILVNGKPVAKMNKDQVREALTNVRAEASKLKAPYAAEKSAKLREARERINQEFLNRK